MFVKGKKQALQSLAAEVGQGRIKVATRFDQRLVAKIDDDLWHVDLDHIAALRTADLLFLLAACGK